MLFGVFCFVFCSALVTSKYVATKLGSYSLATVYSGNKAEVERIVKIDEVLPVTEHHTVSVSGFTENVLDETIRIASEVDVEVLDVKVSTVRTPRANMPEYLVLLKVLEEKSNALMKEKEELDNSYLRIETRLKSAEEYVKHALEKNRVEVTSSGSVKTLSLAEVTSLLDFQASEQEKCNAFVKEIREKQAINRERSHEIAEKILKLNEATYPVEEGETMLPLYRLDKVLTFRIKLSSSKKTEFIVSYMSSTASWSPEYDIRIESKNKQQQTSDGSGAGAVAASAVTAGAAAVRDRSYRLEIDYFANVVQNTGENWVDTPLVLSTANPQMLKKPKLKGLAGNGREAFYSANDDDNSWTFNDAAFTEQVSGLSRDHVLGAGHKKPATVSMVRTNSIKTDIIATGDIGASHKFKVVFPVSVESTNLMLQTLRPGTEHVNQKHLILVDKLVLSTNLYTFAVPSQKTEGYMVSLSKYELTNKEEAASASSPLLASAKARLHIQGDNIGSVKFNAVQPGEMMKLNLGTDKNIHIETVKVVPKMTKEEEEKSSWFFKDKKKFRVRTEERLTTIRSSYPSGSSDREVLVIVAENLPQSLEADEVSVELLSSKLRDAVTLDNEPVTDGKGSSDRSAVVAGPTLTAAAASTDAFIEGIVTKEIKTVTSSPFTVYYCKTSGYMYWAAWLKPGQSVNIPFKYKITWPENHNLHIS